MDFSLCFLHSITSFIKVQYQNSARRNSGGKFLFMILDFSIKRFENSLERGKRINFSLFERKVTKEANQRAVGSLAWGELCHESPVSSARTRVTRTVLLPKAAVRFRTLHGSLGAYIMPRLCASRVVPLSDYRFPQSVISSPPSKAKKALRLFSYGIYKDKFLFISPKSKGYAQISFETVFYLLTKSLEISRFRDIMKLSKISPAIEKELIFFADYKRKIFRRGFGSEYSRAFRSENGLPRKRACRRGKAICRLYPRCACA